MPIDNPMGTIHLERIIAAPPADVFDVVTSSENLRFAPVVLRVKRVREGREGGWSAGSVREVVAAGAWFREEITVIDPPHTFEYRILRSIPPITHFGGTIRVSPVAEGSHVVWRTTFDIPRVAGGKVSAVLAERILAPSFTRILAEAERRLTSAARR
ncbi:SRPBCC family protein [Nocardia sp. NPDC005745]|uniref:SRPBCC family protein n=1 Tax=Nocardia sp. NPDC005745 TaxID=3157061 RepID=UPI00340C8842